MLALCRRLAVADRRLDLSAFESRQRTFLARPDPLVERHTKYRPLDSRSPAVSDSARAEIQRSAEADLLRAHSDRVSGCHPVGIDPIARLGCSIPIFDGGVRWSAVGTD